MNCPVASPITVRKCANFLLLKIKHLQAHFLDRGRPRRQHCDATENSARPGVVSSATRALLSLTTPIGGEAKVALHYLLAADVPSFARRG